MFIRFDVRFLLLHFLILAVLVGTEQFWISPESGLFGLHALDINARTICSLSRA